MKCQILFIRKNDNNITSMSSAEFAHSMVSVQVKFGRQVLGTFIIDYQKKCKPMKLLSMS